MNSSLGSIFIAGLAALMGPATAGILPLMILSAVAVDPPRSRSLAIALLLGMVLFAGVAMRELGVAWPMMDSPARALSQPLSWVSAALLITIALPRLESGSVAAIRIVIVFVVAALMRPALHGPQLALVHAIYPENSAWIGRGFYFLGSALGLAVLFLACVWLIRPLESKRPRQLSQMLLVLVACSFLLGLYGGFLRELLARWPATNVG